MKAKKGKMSSRSIAGKATVKCDRPEAGKWLFELCNDQIVVRKKNGPLTVTGMETGPVTAVAKSSEASSIKVVTYEVDFSLQFSD